MVWRTALSSASARAPVPRRRLEQRSRPSAGPQAEDARHVDGCARRARHQSRVPWVDSYVVATYRSAGFRVRLGVEGSFTRMLSGEQIELRHVRRSQSSRRRSQVSPHDPHDIVVDGPVAPFTIIDRRLALSQIWLMAYRPRRRHQERPPSTGSGRRGRQRRRRGRRRRHLASARASRPSSTSSSPLRRRPCGPAGCASRTRWFIHSPSARSSSSTSRIGPGVLAVQDSGGIWGEN